MIKADRESIVISFIRSKERYEKLAQYVVGLIGNDPAFPKDSLHTMIYRIKSEERLIGKIEDENSRLKAGSKPIGEKNFKARIGDLAGIRFVCLRLSDIDKVDEYLRFLAEEKILRLLEGPEKKRSFILPIDPDEALPKNIVLRYSGYSSIHYQVELGEKSGAGDDLMGMQIEFQVRTILEEAWGEIDHKYRYVLSRSGVELPECIHNGFYTLSAYLQVAAMQAEYLCRQVDVHKQSTFRKPKAETAVEAGDASKSPAVEVAGFSTAGSLQPAELQMCLEDMFGFRITARTLMYVNRRLEESLNPEFPQLHFKKIFKEDRLRTFRAIFRETLGREPFDDAEKRNVDVINLVNFVLFVEAKGSRIAEEGLKLVLKRRGV